MCDYIFRDKTKCSESPFENSNFCILHAELPEDESSTEFKNIRSLKDLKVVEKIKNYDFNFQGAKLFNLDLNHKPIGNRLDFNESVIREDVCLDGITARGDIWFEKSQIGGNVSIIKAQISGDVGFSHSKIRGDLKLWGTKIKGSASFGFAEIEGNANFIDAEINFVGLHNAKLFKDLSFLSAKIDTVITAEDVEIHGLVNFNWSEVKNRICFFNAKFKNPKAEEEGCRAAKILCEKFGKRDEADYYFLREMNGLRRQKGLLLRYLEYFFLKKIFAYGTSWIRVLGVWGVVVFGYTCIYWFFNAVNGANNIMHYLYFSIVTATTLGYGDLSPKPTFQLLASTEAILGTFMWALFVVVFARKYMR